MITGKEAINGFRKKNPGLTVMDAVDLNSEYFVITALKDPSKMDFNGATYAVNKKDGSISAFSITDYGVPEFFEACRERGLLTDEEE